MKSRMLKWYGRHTNAIDAIMDIAGDAIPGAGILPKILKHTLKVGKGLADDYVENYHVETEIESLLSNILPLLSTIVEDIEQLKDFQRAGTIKQFRAAIEQSELKTELEELLPELSQSISPSLARLKSKNTRNKRVIGDKYCLIKKIGRGGQGEVFHAFDLIAENQVALKLLPQEFSNNDMAVRKLREEYGRLVNNLRHPHIVQYRSLGYDKKRQIWFIEMDYIAGDNLRKMLIDHRHTPFSTEETCSILTPIAKALKFSHDCQIIHCDLKPENILVQKKDGTIFLTDFGLAHDIQNSLSTKGTMETGIDGTIPYMAPEQWRGHKVRKATDIWALGVILYEMIEGHHPFNGTSFEHYKTLICRERPEPPENLSRKQWRFLSSMIEKDYKKRPIDPEETIYNIFQQRKKQRFYSIPSTNVEETHPQGNCWESKLKQKKTRDLVKKFIRQYRVSTKVNDVMDMLTSEGEWGIGLSRLIRSTSSKNSKMFSPKLNLVPNKYHLESLA